MLKRLSLRLAETRRAARYLRRSKWAMLWRLRGAWKRAQNSPEDVDEVLSRARLFFLLGSGRSGTKLLSALLDKAEGALVLHEPDFREDVWVMPRARIDGAFSRSYVDGFKKLRIYERVRVSGARFYGEPTGTLCYQAAALRSALPDAHLLLLARDGRDVVRSHMARTVYDDHSFGAKALRPKAGEPWHEAWPTMSRFERICWRWADMYGALLDALPEAEPARLERVLSDYGYFDERLLRPVGLSIGEDVWRAAVSDKVNATLEHTFPHWSEWSSEDTASFARLCGPMMGRLGYEL